MSSQNPGSGIKNLLRRRLPEALFEGVFVVLAVLVALGVDEYWEGLEERELAKTARSRVVAEVGANIDELLNNREKNQTLLRDINEVLAADAAGEASVITGVEYEVSLLGSDAWETARTTRAVHFMDFDIVNRISRVYRVQQLFLERQNQVVDAIANAGGGGNQTLGEVLRPIRRGLTVAIGLECSLMNEYRVLITDLESDPTLSNPEEQDDRSAC